MSTDSIKWHPTISVAKFNPETVADITRVLGRRPTTEDYLHITPDELTVAEGNQLVNGGLQRIADLIVGAAGNPFSSVKGLIGVGNNSTSVAFAPTQTDLQGASKYFIPVSSATAPAGTPGKITASATFLGSDANFAWEEWCFAVATGTPTKSAVLNTAGGGSATMLNRKVQQLGTKAPGAEWTLTADVTLT